MVYISGSKKDVWIAIDPATGAKIQTLSSDGAQKVCPSSTDKLMYIGRTGLWRIKIENLQIATGLEK